MSLISTFSALCPSSGLDPAAVADDLSLARELAIAEKSPATLRAYRSDGLVFDAWVRERGGDASIPSSPEIVAAFLASEVACGMKTSTIDRRAAAIAYAHRAAGYADPMQDEQVKRVLRGIRRTVGVGRAQKAPATSDVIVQMISVCPGTLSGLRDRALLALGFSGAFRRSELSALNLEDLAFEPAGLRVSIRKSKTDQEGQGHEIAIPNGHTIRPVDAVQTWLGAAGIAEGAVFRSMTRSQLVRYDRRLTDGAIAVIVKSYAARAGLDPALFSGHSLRAGFVTTAAEHDVADSRIREVTRHRDSRSLQIYIRRANLFRGHAGERFL